MGVDVLDGVLRSIDVTREPERSVALGHIRWRFELPTIAVSIVLNLALVIGALWVATAGWEWAAHRPILGGRKAELWAILAFAIFALPAGLIGRRSRRMNIRGNGVLVSETQHPELHALHLQLCRTLGLSHVPELYVSQELDEMASAASVFGARPCVVISAKLLVHPEWRHDLDVMAFAIAHGLAAIRLGHTQWWLETLTAYAVRIPILRTPVLEAQAFSRDRCAAFAVPGGIRGLVVLAAGKELLADVDVCAFIDQSRAFGGFWAWFAEIATRTTPHTCTRVRRLYEAGLFDLAGDRARHRRRSDV